MKQTFTLLLTTLMLAITGCSYTPDPQDDIALFQDFIDTNKDKKSDDPYISSTVKPEDDLYPFLVSLQHGKYDWKTLDRLIEENNAQAIYWYASLDLIEIKNRQKNFELLDKAAQMGLPYAAWALSNQNYNCSLFLGSASIVSDMAKNLGKDTSFEKKACSEDYLHLSIRLAKEKAKQGDLRSQYFLLKQLTSEGELVPQVAGSPSYNSNYYHLNHSQETREYFIKEVIRFAENHYYQPLMDYVDTILFLTGEYPNNRFTAKTPEQYQLAIDLLTIMANHNYIPALNRLVDINGDDLKKDAPIYQQLFQLGGGRYFISRAHYFSEQYTQEELYVFAHAYEVMNSSNSLFMWVEDDPRSLQRQEELEKQAELLLQKMTPMVYIDGFTSRSDWIEIK